MSENMVGKLLDNRYEILELIGSGGMADVYKAKCHLLDRLVALKFLRTDLAQNEEFRNRFKNESRAVAMLSHPNIVTIYDVSKRDDMNYIVMELIDGITLKQYMKRRGQMSWNEILHFMTQILKALSHAHSRGIVHRDIKPQNIMVLRDGTIKVADFGIASLQNKAAKLKDDNFGSVHYIAPEQATGNTPDARFDIYSTGVIFYEMLTGRLPFEGDSPMSIALQHINSCPVSPREINPEIPAALESICLKAMANDINQRYESAALMLADIERYQNNPQINIEYTFQQPRVEENDINDETVSKPVKNTANEKSESKVNGLRLKEWQRIGIYSMIGILAVLVVFFLGKSIFGSIKPVSTDVFVTPNLLGYTVDEANQLEVIKTDGWTILVKGKKYSDDYETGCIIEQSPESGKEKKSNLTIEVYTSAGSNHSYMPDVIGKDFRIAQTNITKLGRHVVFEFTSEYNDSIPEGIVISVSPTVGEAISEGDTITIHYSLGKEPTMVKIPVFVGHSIEEVQDMLNEMNLKMGEVTEAYSDAVNEGFVLEQNIEPASEVEEGSEVSFVVSKGPYKELEENGTSDD